MNSDYELIFEGLEDDAPETLQRVKGAFIADLELSISQVQEILASIPSVILKSPAKDKIIRCEKVLKKAGAKVSINEADNDMEEFLDDDAFEIPDTDLQDVLSEFEEQDQSLSFNTDLGSQVKEEKKVSETKDTTDKSQSLDLNKDIAFDLKEEEELISSDNTVDQIKRSDIAPLDLDLGLDAGEDKAEESSPAPDLKDPEPTQEEKSDSSEGDDLSFLEIDEDDSLIDNSKESASQKTSSSEETREKTAASSVDPDKDTPLFEFDDLEEALEAIKTEEDPPEEPKSEPEDGEIDDLMFQLDESLENVAPKKEEKGPEKTTAASSDPDDTELEFGFEDDLTPAEVEPESQPPAQGDTDDSDLDFSEDLSASLTLNAEPEAKSESSPPTTEEKASPAPSGQTITTMKLSDTMKKRSPKKEEPEEESKVESEADSLDSEPEPEEQEEKKGPPEMLIYILVIVMGAIVLGIGNYLYFSGPAEEEEFIELEKAKELIERDLITKKDVKDPLEPVKPTSFLLAGKDTAAKVESDSEFSVKDNKLVSGTITVSTPKPPELTPEEIVTHKLQDPWLRKIVVEKLDLTLQEKGKFTATGKAKAYIAGQRILTDARLSGELNLESGELTGEIKVIHNFSVKKNQKAGYNVKRLGGNKYSFYAVAKISAKMVPPEEEGKKAN